MSGALIHARFDLLKADGKAHAIHLTRVDEGMPAWAFNCLHDDADEKWATRDEAGNIVNWQPGECWLESWWSECGGELLDIHGDLHTFPLAVKPGADWEYDNGGVLVVDQ